MKKYLLYTIVVLGIGSMLTTSCLEENLGVGNIKQEMQGGEGWNKNKTIEIYYLTNLSDAVMGAVPGVIDYFNGLGNACSLGVIDRVDVLGNNNIATEIAFKTSRFSSYALNKVYMNGTDIATQGSLLLFNHKINSEEGFKITNDCYIKYINVMTKTTTENPIDILVPFSTVRFSNKEQIAAASTAFTTLNDNQHAFIMVGTVKKDLVEDLKNVAEGLEGCAFTEVAKNPAADYVVFMMGSKSWVLRETTDALVSGDLNAYRLSIEAGVE